MKEMHDDLIEAIKIFELESMTFLYNKVQDKTIEYSIIKESVKLDSMYNISFDYLDERGNKRKFTYNYFNDLCEYHKKERI